MVWIKLDALKDCLKNTLELDMYTEFVVYRVFIESQIALALTNHRCQNKKELTLVTRYTIYCY